LLEIALCLAGVAAGIGLGLIPGMHINNILPFFVMLPFVDTHFFFFITSVSMAYTFSSFFPSILLGVPNEDTALSVLPGHRMVLSGDAYTALRLSFLGGLCTLLFCTLFLGVFLVFIPELYPALKSLVPWALIAIVLFVILTDRKTALLVFLLSAVLGMMTLNYNALLPLLTGFFGMSTLIISLLQESTLPPQIVHFRATLSSFCFLRTSFLAGMLSSFFGVLPGVSSSIVAHVGGLLGKYKPQEFLVLIGGTNVAYMVYSFFVLMLIGRTRSGSAVFLSPLVSGQSLLFIFCIALFSGVVAALLCLTLSGKLVKLYKKVDYRKATVFSIAFLTIINFVFVGWFGLLVLGTATSVGLACNFLRVRRINCMNALIVPAIIVLL
jgi:putative membrane protein